MYQQDLAQGRAKQNPEPPVAPTPAQDTSNARAAEDAQALVECKSSIEKRKADYRRLVSTKEYWSASLALRRCAQLMNDSALGALVADAEKRQYVMEIEARGTSEEARNRAIEALLRDYPEVGKRYRKLLSK